jgi:hypothetical protein
MSSAVNAGLSDEASGVSDDGAKLENTGNAGNAGNAGNVKCGCCEKSLVIRRLPVGSAGKLPEGTRTPGHRENGQRDPARRALGA